MAIWEAAKSEPIGIILNCGSDPVLVRAALYRARSDSHDPELMNFEIGTSKFPDEGQLQIIRVQRAHRTRSENLGKLLDLD